MISWLLLLISLPLCACVIWTIRETNYEIEVPTYVEDIPDEKIGGIAMPEGHHAGHAGHTDVVNDEEVPPKTENAVV